MSLIRAVQNDGINSVQDLLEKEVDVNYVDSDGKSALYYAIEKKNSSIVELLLERKADIYLEVSNNNDILADRASRIYESEGKILDTNEKDISQLIEEKILEDSVRILKECEEPEQSDPKDENTEASLVKAKAEVREKIDELLTRLEDRDSSDYKDANTFIRFLETFAFDDDLTRNYVKNLKREFLNDDHTAYISVKKFRGVLLKSSGKIRNPENIFNGIRFCFILENKDCDVDKKKQFFDELEKYLKCYKIENSTEPVENNICIISNFFKCQNEKQIKDIVNGGQTDDVINKIIYKKFVNLILKAYKNEVDEEEHWFEFNVNIFPCLGITRNEEKNEIGQIEEIKKRRLLENQMLRLRNNFVHSFVQHKPEAFKDVITKLKGKLFEYYYARKLHESLITSITWDVKEIEDEINKDFESIQNEFTRDNKLYWSEEKSANQSIQKFEDMLLPMLLSDDRFLNQPLVEDYFMFMPIIEYMNKNERDKSYSKCRNNCEDIQESRKSSAVNVNQCLKLDDRSRRQFFERFENIKDCKEKSDKEKYTQEKESLINDLRRYGVDRKCVEKIFRCYLEEGNKLSDAVSTVIKKVVKFIVCLIDVKRKFIKNSTLIDIVESILKDPADLVLRVDFPQVPEDIPEHPIIQKLVKTFTSVKINDVEVDVKATIKTMVKTFCYHFYLFRVEHEFNARDLFSRETFLNALLNEEEKLLQDYSEKRGADKVRLFTLVNQLIKIDYMSPFIAKLVNHLDNKDSCFIQRLINKDMMKRLIKNLANKDFLDYLSILLSVKFVTYNPYLLLYDYITENIKNLDEDENSKPLIFSIFNNFDHIRGFEDVLFDMENKHCFDYVEEIVIPFLETINKKVANELHYASCYGGSQFKILLNKKLNDDLTGVTAPDPTVENQVEILNKNEEKYQEQYNIMSEILLRNDLIEIGLSNQIAPCHVHFIERDILEVQINSTRRRFYTLRDIKLLSSTIDKLDKCQDIKHSEIHGRYKLLIFGLFPDISKLIGLDYTHLYCKILKHVKGKDCGDTGIENVRETYEEIKDNNTYKELLSTSDLLQSSLHLDVFRVASWTAFYNLMNIQKRSSKCRDESKLLRILNVYKSIYSHHKKDTKNIKTVEHLKYIANVYKELGIACGAKNKYGKASSYCLKSLARYNMYYEIRKDMHLYFVENAIKNNMLYALINYIFARYKFSKTLKSKKNLDKREEILKKFEVLCNKILDCNKNSTNVKKWGKHYVKILSVLANIRSDRGKCCLKRKLIDEATTFFDQALNLFNEIPTSKRITSMRQNECFASPAVVNNAFFLILIQYFADKYGENGKSCRVPLSIDKFPYKIDHDKCKKLKKRLKYHCIKDHDLKLESILKNLNKHIMLILKNRQL